VAEQGEFRFEIAGFDPTTLSMERLTAYLPHLVELFGHKNQVHLLRVDHGSATPCMLVDNSAVPSVNRRIVRIKSGGGSRASYRAMDSINELLAEDETSAELKSPHYGIVIEFPGIKQANDPIVGPISEYADVQGELFQIGGRDETISLYIRNDQNLFICTATRDQGRDIAQHLFRSVRVSGMGKWIRTETGRWKLRELVLDRFAQLSKEPLGRSIDQLRAITDNVPGERLDIESDSTEHI
jgi:hypothetical protein